MILNIALYIVFTYVGPKVITNLSSALWTVMKEVSVRRTGIFWLLTEDCSPSKRLLNAVMMAKVLRDMLLYLENKASCCHRMYNVS